MMNRVERCRLEGEQEILKAAEQGVTVSDVSRQYNIGQSPIYNWRRRQAVAVLRPPGRLIGLPAEGGRLALLMQETLECRPLDKGNITQVP